MATFTVERLDAPIERIEIRLIDENSNSTALNPAPPPPESLNSAAGATQQSGAVAENAINGNVESADQYDVRYKKVEYVSDVILTEKTALPQSSLLIIHRTLLKCSRQQYQLWTNPPHSLVKISHMRTRLGQ
ncbi:hypothetical protein KIN20_024478, partial [Parelaphostrongylus tenuis]